MSQSEYQEINISEIDADTENKYHCRESMNDETIDAIAESLKDGRLYQPIVVVREGDNRYKVVDGEHRLAAHKKVNKDKITVFIINDDDKALTWGIKANMLRSDYNAMEKSNALQKLFDIRKTEETEHSGEYNQTKLAEEIGLSKGSVSDYLLLQSLPEEIKKEAVKDKFSSVITLRSISRSKKSHEEKIAKYKDTASKAKLAAQKKDGDKSSATDSQQEDSAKSERKKRTLLYIRIESQKDKISKIIKTISEMESTIIERKNSDKLDIADLKELLHALDSVVKDLVDKASSLQNTISNKG